MSSKKVIIFKKNICVILPLSLLSCPKNIINNKNFPEGQKPLEILD